MHAVQDFFCFSSRSPFLSVVIGAFVDMFCVSAPNRKRAHTYQLGSAVCNKWSDPNWPYIEVIKYVHIILLPTAMSAHKMRAQKWIFKHISTAIQVISFQINEFGAIG